MSNPPLTLLKERDELQRQLEESRQLHVISINDRTRLQDERDAARREVEALKVRLRSLTNLVCETAHNFPSSTRNEEDAIVQAIEGGIKKAVSELSESSNGLLKEVDMVTDGGTAPLTLRRAPAKDQAEWKRPLRKTADALRETLKRWRSYDG